MIRPLYKNVYVITLFLLTALFPLHSSAYEPTKTHAGLTEQIVEFHNLSAPYTKITDIQKELIIQGSIDEDRPSIRAVNHFYDPTNNTGISGGRTAKEWAMGNVEINRYTWQNAVKFYAEGKDDQSFITLGHILHLIEDVSVPDHTRNDAHKGEGLDGLYTGNSPFEDWARDNKNRTTLQGEGRRLFQQGKRPIINTDLGSYFDNLANYSNKNFFSKDSIQNEIYQYSDPEITNLDEDYGYGVDKLTGKKVKLVVKEKKEGEKNIYFYVLRTKEDSSVLVNYFDRLFPQAIMSGAGVVDLFLKQASQAREKYQYEQKQKENARMQRDAYLLVPFSFDLSLFTTLPTYLGKRVVYGVSDASQFVAKKVIYPVTDGIASTAYKGLQQGSNYAITFLSSGAVTTEIGINSAAQKATDVKDFVVQQGRKSITIIQQQNKQNLLTINPYSISLAKTVDQKIVVQTPVIITTLSTTTNPLPGSLSAQKTENNADADIYNTPVPGSKNYASDSKRISERQQSQQRGGGSSAPVVAVPTPEIPSVMTIITETPTPTPETPKETETTATSTAPATNIATASTTETAVITPAPAPAPIIITTPITEKEIYVLASKPSLTTEEESIFIEGFMDMMVIGYSIPFDSFISDVGITEGIRLITPMIEKKVGPIATEKIKLKYIPDIGWVVLTGTDLSVLDIDADLSKQCLIPGTLLYEGILKKDKTQEYFCGKLAAKTSFLVAGIAADKLSDTKLPLYLTAKNWKVTMAQAEVIIEKQRRSRPRFREF